MWIINVILNLEKITVLSIIRHNINIKIIEIHKNNWYYKTCKPYWIVLVYSYI